MVTHSNKWLQYEATEGQGSDNQFMIYPDSAKPHTGRNDRTATLTFSLKEGSSVTPIPVTITQKAAALFVEYTGENISVGKDSITVTVTGRTNADGVLIEPSSVLDTSVAPIPTSGITLTAGGVRKDSASTAVTYTFSNSNRIVPLSSYGTTEAYTFDFKMTIPANDTVDLRKIKYNLNIFSGGINNVGPTTKPTSSAVFTIEQTAGDATLSVSPTTLTFNADGTPAAGSQDFVAVTSNTEWTVA